MRPIGAVSLGSSNLEGRVEDEREHLLEHAAGSETALVLLVLQSGGGR